MTSVSYWASRALLVLFLPLLVGAFVIPSPRIARGAAAAAQTARHASADDEEVQELYRLVAEQDPEWFQSFVVDLLGEDAVGQELVSLAKNKSLNGKSSPVGNDDTKMPALAMDNLKVKSPAKEVESSDETEMVNTDEEVSEDMVEQDVLSPVDEEEEPLVEATEAINEQATLADEDGNDPVALDDAKDDESSDEEAMDTIENVDEEPSSRVEAEPVEARGAELNATAIASTAVLYFDAISESWKGASMSRLVSLGYTQSEITSLLPDALDLIVEERIPRPRTGVPTRWKGGSGNVRLMSVDEVDAFIKQQNEKAQAASVSVAEELEDEEATIPPRRRRRSARVEATDEDEAPRQRRLPRDEADLDYEDETRPSMEAIDHDEPRRRSRADGLDERPLDRRRRSRDDGRDRPIYSGRPSTPKRSAKQLLADPPPPNSSLWPDIDAFRNMLRSEASLRLRILGDDFADVVKEESDWRLGLYKDWLWTLHNGIGDPIVESRSDRDRRRRRQSPALPKQSSERQGRRKKSSKSRDSIK